MKKSLYAGAILAAMLLSTPSFAQSRLFISGTLAWPNGAPAVGMVVVLRAARGGAVSAQTYSNLAGKFAFFDIHGTPTDYVLAVKDGTGHDVAQVGLTGHAIGSNIRLVLRRT